MPTIQEGQCEQCPICHKQLYSIITRRVGDTSVCIDCGDTISPLITALAEDIIVKCKQAREHGIEIRTLLPTLLNDYELDDETTSKILAMNGV